MFSAEKGENALQPTTLTPPAPPAPPALPGQVGYTNPWHTP